MFLLSLTATCQVCTVSLKAGLSTYKWLAGDGVQRPLRSRFPPRLTPGVRPLKKHMTKFTELLKGNLVDDAIEYRVHATRRMFQRHIGAEEVAFILTHGQVIERDDEDFPLPSVLRNGRTAANRPLHVVVGINVDE